MRKITFIFLISICISSYVNAQQLDINETLDYIEKIENKYRVGWTNSFVEYQINDDGFLIQNEYYLKDSTKLRSRTTVHFDDIVRKVEIENDDRIELKCKHKNCFIYEYRRSSKDENMRKVYINHDENDLFEKGLRFVVRQEYQARKIANAIHYLFSLIQNKKLLRDIDDPFAKNIIPVENNNSVKKNSISLTEKNGTFLINVRFKSFSIPFVLDSGAAEISISSTLEKRLLQYGIITKNNYLSDGLYRVADGRIVSQRRVLLKKVQVGDFIVKNVAASIGGEDTPLLLGKNFLDKFSNWSINNSDSTLELKI